MKKDSRQRLFEVMGRLDKTFNPKLNENFGEIEDEIPAEIGGDGVDAEVSMDEPKELSPEEKLAELTAKVDEMHALLHGGDEGGEPEAIEDPTGEVDVEVDDAENLQEWNFDKKKGEDKKEKAEDEEDEKEEKDEVDETEEKKPKIPVAAVAKVGK